MSNQDVVLDVQRVSMEFKIIREKVESIKEYFIKRIKMEIQHDYFSALNNVSFKVYKGDVFGIIGLNGAGKSTLLKIISGILKPTQGKVTRIGTIAPLIELGAGFDGQLSGKENIYLNGMLLGYSKKFLTEKMEEIITFSELEEFIHSPLKNYSSGMKARLGFSIATSMQPDLLIVDEVLSVGDVKFKEKCETKIKGMIEEGTTVLFVSHSLGQIERLCNKVMWLQKGSILKIGEANEICKEFKNYK